MSTVTNATPCQGNDTSPAVTQLLRRTRLRVHDRAVRGSGVALLASTGDLNFSVLNVEESFERLSHEQRLRLYYITRAIREAHKLSFLQSSCESPAILLLFQELFSSPEQELSPGELILELQKSCSAKGLNNAVSRLFKYVVLFYHNSGNYDLETGVKILPEMTQTEFEDVIQSSRAYMQRRGRVQRATEACLAAIFSSGDHHSTSAAQKSSVSENPGATTEATIVPMNEKLAYPFYGPGVGYMDAVRVDRTLDTHEILKINTRIVKVVDDASDNTHAMFQVFQASFSAENKAHSEAEPHKPTSETLMMANQDQIQLTRHDFGSFLAKMAAFLKLAGRYEPDATPRLEEKTLALCTVPSIGSWKALRHAWLVNGQQEDQDKASGVDFLLGFSNLPSHRDPLGTRGALEGFVVVRNDFYQQRIDRIIRPEGALESTFLHILPFHQLMTDTRSKLEKLNVACVDLVFASRSGSMLPVVSNLDVDDKPSLEPEKLLFIANCAENYTDGRLTGETYYLIDGLFSTENARVVRHEWSCVVFLRFVAEEVVAPRTRVLLRGDDKGVSPQCGGKSIALLPAELLVESSDEEDLLLEDDSDLDEDEDTIRVGELLDASAREALLLHSSYAKRPTQWYSHDPTDTYRAKFHERLATVLEECRVVLAGLLLALDDSVRQKVCSNWYVPDTEDYKRQGESSSKDPLHDVALAYVLLVLRDGLLALPFFATQQFRWEDDKMLARHMVLQMLLEGGPEAFDANEKPRSKSDAVVGVKAIEERVNRDIAQLALGIDEIRVRSLEVLVHTDAVEISNQRKRSWRHRLKIHVRGWLQQIQWIQMTGDVRSGQRLYERFSLVSDESLRYRSFILLQLGDPDTVRKAGEAAGCGTGRPISRSSDPHFVTGGSSSEPLPHTPKPSMEVRNKLLGIRNPSHFCRNTIWIPPFLQLNELVSDANGALRAKKRAHSSDNAFDVGNGEVPEVNDTAEQLIDGDYDVEEGVIRDEEHTAEAVKQVELRMFQADLSYALEAAVLNIGIITDTEAAAFRISKA